MTPSDNYFTISPHNLALLNSTLLHSYPVPLSTHNTDNNNNNISVNLKCAASIIIDEEDQTPVPYIDKNVCCNLHGDIVDWFIL